jgi:hypothetical protein
VADILVDAGRDRAGVLEAAELRVANEGRGRAVLFGKAAIGASFCSSVSAQAREASPLSDQRRNAVRIAVTCASRATEQPGRIVTAGGKRLLWHSVGWLLDRGFMVSL